MSESAQRKEELVDLEGLAGALGRIRLLRLGVVLRSAGEARLPRWLGSTIRGAFARSLKRISCALRHEECTTCLLRERCVYSVLLETPRPAGLDRLRGQPRLPHPLVLTPPGPRDDPWREGDELELGLTLFGKATEHFPYVIAAIQEAGREGLGRGRAVFELVSVRATPFGRDPIGIFRAGEPLGQVEPFSLDGVVAAGEPGDRVTLRLLTPTRLATGGRLTRSPTLEVFVRSLLTRALAMLIHDGEGLDLDIEGITAVARTVETARSDLRLVKLTRQSTRQRKLIPLDGMMGELTFEGGAVGELWPLLRAGELLRVGGGTVFGLGQYAIINDIEKEREGAHQ